MAFINTDNNFKKIDGFFGDEQEVIATYSVKPDLFQITTFDNESDRKNRYVKESIQLNLKDIRMAL